MAEAKKVDIAILILSCDKYKDLWDGYIHQFKKNFDLDMPIYFGTNQIRPNIHDLNIRIIQSGPDSSWSESFRKIIDQINEQYILITLEDLYITSRVDRILMNKVQKFINEHSNIKHLKYTGYIKGRNYVISEVSELEGDTPYRVTLCGIWEKQYLQTIIQPEESPWEFEIKGSERTKMDKGFYALDNPLFETVNLVEKGKWNRKSVKWAVNQNIPLNIQSRRFKNFIQEIISFIKDIYFNFMIKVPLEKKQLIIRKIKKFLVMN